MTRKWRDLKENDAFDVVGKLWNEPLNINLSNHDLREYDYLTDENMETF